MRVLVACEFSGTVRDAFRARGHDAYSCDLLPTESEIEGGYHLEGDVSWWLPHPPAHYDFTWDLMIAHPPCTYLTIAAEWAYKDGPYHQRVKPDTLTGAARREARREAIEFVKFLWRQPIKKICIENPIGVLRHTIGPHTQILQPNKFGHDASKATCLWLKNLPPLQGTKTIAPRIVNGRPRWGNQTDSGQNSLSPNENRWKERSMTYAGIAQAMAEQWGKA